MRYCINFVKYCKLKKNFIQKLNTHLIQKRFVEQVHVRYISANSFQLLLLATNFKNKL